MPNFRFLSLCFDDSEEAQYALIELIDEDIQLLAIRRKAFLEAKAKDEHLYDHRYRSFDTSFFSSLVFKGEEGKEIGADEYLSEASTLALAEKDEIFSENSKLMETTTDMLVVDEEGVFWQSYPEYGVGTLQTEMLTWGVLLGDKL